MPIELVATKTVRNGQTGLRVYRNPDGTAHIERDAGTFANVPALAWDSDLDPETWIAYNGPRSQHQWKWNRP